MELDDRVARREEIKYDKIHYSDALFLLGELGDEIIVDV